MSAAPRVLLVEDHVDSAEMLQMVLEDVGYAVRWAPTGTAALGELQPADGAGADVVLLDLMLPDMTGAVVVQTARTRGWPVPPVIVLSARSDESIAELSLEIGAVSALRKPFRVDALLDLLAQVLSARA